MFSLFASQRFIRHRFFIIFDSQFTTQFYRSRAALDILIIIETTSQLARIFFVRVLESVQHVPTAVCLFKVAQKMHSFKLLFRGELSIMEIVIEHQIIVVKVKKRTKSMDIQHYKDIL